MSPSSPVVSQYIINNDKNRFLCRLQYSSMLSEFECPSESFAHDLVHVVRDFAISPPPSHPNHLSAYVLLRLRLLVPLICMLPHRPPPPQQRAPPPHDADRTFRAYIRLDAVHEVSPNESNVLRMWRKPHELFHPSTHHLPHVCALHRRRRTTAAAQAWLFSLRKVRAGRWGRWDVLVRALGRSPAPFETP